MIRLLAIAVVGFGLSLAPAPAEPPARIAGCSRTAANDP